MATCDTPELTHVSMYTYYVALSLLPSLSLSPYVSRPLSRPLSLSPSISKIKNTIIPCSYRRRRYMHRRHRGYYNVYIRMVLARICVHACLHTHRHMFTFFLRLSGMGNPEVSRRLSEQIEVEQQYKCVSKYDSCLGVVRHVSHLYVYNHIRVYIYIAICSCIRCGHTNMYTYLGIYL